MLYNLNKKGTIIITIGRSGSHLLGDIISNKLTKNNIEHKSFKEMFLYPPTVHTIDTFYKTAKNKLINFPCYTIVQVQDFNSKLWLLTYENDWLSDYHVIILKRTDNIAHFFSKQILENFHATVPVHTFKGINSGSFASLQNKSLTVDIDSVWQFYSEKQILNRFIGDETVIYEDMIQWDDVKQSMYLKNNYTVAFQDLFTNYNKIVEMLTPSIRSN